MNSSPYAGRRALLKFGAFVLLCSLPWTAQAQTDADRDGNGLIEIDSLLMLHNMRYNLAGTSYKTTSTASVGNSSGCPDTGCIGYELIRNLDFDVNGDGSTWSRNHEGSYTLDVDDRNDYYFPVDGDGTGGWLPIGGETNPFAAVFDGNGHTISNLAIRRDQTYIGLFGRMNGVGESVAAIRNLGLIDSLANYTGSSSNSISIGGDDVDGNGGFVGGLLGLQESGSISASYVVAGAVAGGNGPSDLVGGLVGLQFGGSIMASYATGDADGGDGNNDYVGGLVGVSGGSITASYATGDADGGDGDYEYVGGLVGLQIFDGSITASYATGDADGGDGNEDSVGGLVGFQQGSITASYATGDANGGDGPADFVGGLVGYQQGSITASYATGDADGGDGEFDFVGGLVGLQEEDVSITASYATGDADGGDGDYDRVGGLVGLQGTGSSITASYATGDADGGVGDQDFVGGLVGAQEGGSITASYATGDADGGDGDDDFVGGLVGYQQFGSITASYGFGGTIGGEAVGSEGSTKPQGVSTAAQLTADPANAGSAWNSAANNTLGAWDFGTDEQIPALNYADYDGPGTVFDCSQFPTSCGTQLPRQADSECNWPFRSGVRRNHHDHRFAFVWPRGHRILELGAIAGSQGHPDGRRHPHGDIQSVSHRHPPVVRVDCHGQWRRSIR